MLALARGFVEDQRRVTATLSDSTGARIGIVTRTSAASTHVARQAGAFAAEQHGGGAARSHSSSGVPPRGTVATSATPATRAASDQRVGARLRDDRQAERAAHRSRAAPSSRTDRRVPAAATTPVAPQASAARTMRADVARILHVDEHEQQRGGSASKHVGQRRGGTLARCATTPDGCAPG